MNDMLPEGWERKKLGEISIIKSGATPLRLKSDEYFTRNGISWVKTLDLNNSYIIKSQEEITDKAIKESSCSIFPINTVLVAMYGGFNQIGRTGLLKIPAAINQAISALQLDQDKIYSEYVLHFLNANTFMWKKFAASSRKDPNITRKDICSFIISLPPLPEQKKIASILSSIDEVIEKTTAQVAKLNDLKTSLMQELLTKGIGHSEFKDSPVGRIPVEWEVVKTGHVTKSIVPGRNKPKKFDGDIPWLTIADLNSIYVHASTKKLGVSRNILDEAKGKTLPKNTVIMSVVGEFGISSIASCELVINQQLHGFVCNKKIAPTFLCLILRFYKKQIEKLATQTTIAYINKDNAESILFALPPLDEQKKISSSILSIDQKITTTNQKLSALTHTKKALMQDLLTGKKRVTV